MVWTSEAANQNHSGELITIRKPKPHPKSNKSELCEPWSLILKIIHSPGNSNMQPQLRTTSLGSHVIGVGGTEVNNTVLAFQELTI